VQIPNLKLVFVLFGLMITQLSFAQYQIQVLDSNTFNQGEGVILSKTSFRGLSVVDDNTIWVSGSRGTFARSTNGGKTFTYTQLKGYEKSDFRDIEAFDDKRAVMMSSGTPAYILKTIDGGQTWKEVYKNTDSAYFLDAMDFWDEQHGVLVGDPINGHFVLLKTNNGGETWQELDTTETPSAMDGEAVFAASGTSLRCWGKDEFGFVTGGMYSAIYVFKNFELKGRCRLGINQGKASSGAFSFSKYAGYALVGGDYLDSTIRFKKYVLNSLNGVYGESFEDYYYLSCIEHISWLKGYITCGPHGVYLNANYISNKPFHVVRKAKNGSAVFLAGPKGKIGKLVKSK
jgi:hypothetical protein